MRIVFFNLCKATRKECKAKKKPQAKSGWCWHMNHAGVSPRYFM